MEKCGVFGLFIVDDVFSGQNQGIVPDFERMSQNIKFVVGRKVANDVFFKGIKIGTGNRVFSHSALSSIRS